MATKIETFYQSDEDVPSNKKLTDRLNSYFISFLWLAGGVSLLYYTNMIDIVRYDKRINRYTFLLSIFTFSTVICIFTYLIVTTRMINKVRVKNLFHYSPRLIQAATLLSFLTYFSCVVTIFPIWGWLSVLIVLVLWIALIFSMNFIPNF